MYDFILINQSIFAKDDGMPDQVGQDGKEGMPDQVGQDGVSRSGRTGSRAGREII